MHCFWDCLKKNSGYGSLGVRYFLIPLNITLCFELNWIIIFECWLCFPATKFHSMSAHRFVPKSIHFWGPYFPLKTNGIVVFPIKEQQCLFTIIVSSSEHQLWLYGECALAHIFLGFSLRSVSSTQLVGSSPEFWWNCWTLGYFESKRWKDFS